MMTISQQLTTLTEELRGLPYGEPRLEAEELLCRVLGIERVELYRQGETKLTGDHLSELRSLVARRLKGEPLAYILNSKWFYGSEFYVDENVLVPRPESEHLIEVVNTHAIKVASAKSSRPLEIADLGAGSGCLGVTLLKEISNSRCTFFDISAKALDVAKKNSESLGVFESSRFINTNVELLATNADFAGQFDIVVANPPYLHPDYQNSTLAFEPKIALYAEEGGLKCHRLWIPAAVKLLKESGVCAFEIGFDQSKAVCALFLAAGFTNIECVKDLQGHDRVVFAEKSGRASDK